MRAAVKGPQSTWYVSTAAIAVPPDGAWQHVAFDLAASTMTNVNFGPESLADVLGGVTELRILSAAAGPTFTGDAVAATLGADNLRALRLPGDATFDNQVDFNDLVALAQHYNTVGGMDWADGDFTFDGTVDFADLVVLAQGYNTAGPAAAVPGAPGGFVREVAAAFAAVPEPSTAALLVVSGISLGAARRRRAAR
jgi:hypothetical protein